jgi:hypothetical protein
VRGAGVDAAKRAGGGSSSSQQQPYDPSADLGGIKLLTEAADARHRFEGALFLVKSNQGMYGGLVQELANDFNKGRDSYPDTLTAAYELMLHDVRDRDSRNPPHGDPGLAFNNVGGR